MCAFVDDESMGRTLPDEGLDRFLPTKNSHRFLLNCSSSNRFEDTYSNFTLSSSFGENGSQLAPPIAGNPFEYSSSTNQSQSIEIPRNNSYSSSSNSQGSLNSYGSDFSSNNPKSLSETPQRDIVQLLYHQLIDSELLGVKTPRSSNSGIHTNYSSPQKFSRTGCSLSSRGYSDSLADKAAIDATSFFYKNNQISDISGFSSINSSQFNKSPTRILNYSNTSPFNWKHDILSNSANITDPYSVSPISIQTVNSSYFNSPHKSVRKICKSPFKVLNAPSLGDDFYLNLVDWSATNTLAVGLNSSVFLWSACTSMGQKLLSFPNNQSNSQDSNSGINEQVTSVAWTQKGNHLAVGLKSGNIEIWDTQEKKRIRTMNGHSLRIGTLAWNGPILSSGSRDQIILNHDVRQPNQWFSKWNCHKQEVCGLKWSPSEQQLASGGNDNKLVVWQLGNENPLLQFKDHTAAVKAIAWSPHQHGILASGGGTADRCIRFWNTLTRSAFHKIDTGSQVCNLAWSRNVNELVSTHGYSLNQIIVWKYPTMQKIATLIGHTYRVLYLAVSPEGETIVTGAGDDSLIFWNIFPPVRSKQPSGADQLKFNNISVVR